MSGYLPATRGHQDGYPFPASGDGREMEVFNQLEQCQRCRECCWNPNGKMTVIFTDAEIMSIREVCRVMPRFRPYRGSNKVFQVELRRVTADTVFYACPFLDTKTHECVIYEKRPFDCRSWPFFFSEGKIPGTVTLSCIAGACPAMREAAEEDLIAYQQYMINLLTSEEYLGLIRNYPELIWEYKDNSACQLMEVTDLLRLKHG